MCGRSKGTAISVFVLSVITEGAVEKQSDVYMCFVDSEKAFDMLRHEDVLSMLNNIGVDRKNIKLIIKFVLGPESGSEN